MSKSIDEKVTESLVAILRDGEKGFLAAADKLADSSRADVAVQFRQLSAQRRMFTASG
jgi:hypothetical protein